MAELIDMLFVRLTYVGLKNQILDRGQDQMNPFAGTRGDKRAMQPFAKLL